MKIGFIGTGSSGTSFIVDHIAQLLVKDGKSVYLKDTSKSASVYKKYALSKQQQALNTVEPVEGYVIGRTDPENDTAFDYYLYDIDDQQGNLGLDGILDLLIVVTNLDYHKYKHAVEEKFSSILAVEAVKKSLVVNQAHYGKVRYEAVIVGTEAIFDSVYHVEYDSKSYDLDLFGRMTGEANVLKLSSHTKKQLKTIATELFCASERLKLNEPFWRARK